MKDAVKEGVKRVGRESQLKLRYFIANKELASVKADLHLPLIVLTDTFGSVLTIAMSLQLNDVIIVKKIKNKDFI